MAAERKLENFLDSENRLHIYIGVKYKNQAETLQKGGFFLVSYVGERP